jgi:hypothetical protein
MIDAAYLKAHRTASSLRSEMAGLRIKGAVGSGDRKAA